MPSCNLTTFTELRSGELVKDEFFTLFEAVGALEVCHGSSPVWLLAYHVK